MASHVDVNSELFCVKMELWLSSRPRPVCFLAVVGNTGWDRYAHIQLIVLNCAL